MPRTGRVSDSVVLDAKCESDPNEADPNEARFADYDSKCAVKPALAIAAMARSTGAGSWAEEILAVPTVTSSTTKPGVPLNAWLTRRTQEPQCIPSIFNLNSAILFSPTSLSDDSGNQRILEPLAKRGRSRDSIP